MTPKLSSSQSSSSSSSTCTISENKVASSMGREVVVPKITSSPPPVPPERPTRREELMGFFGCFPPFSEERKAAAVSEERRGSLKAFAHRVLERKGSCNNNNGLLESVIPSSPARKRRLLRAAVGFNSESDIKVKLDNDKNQSRRGGSLRIVKRELEKTVLNRIAMADDFDSGSYSPKASVRTRKSRKKSEEEEEGETTTVRKVTVAGRASSDSGFETIEVGLMKATSGNNIAIRHIDLDAEYDIVQKIGDGWFSRVYLAENRQTREEIVLKALNSKTVSQDEFLTEFRHSLRLTSHKNVLNIFDDVFQSNGYYMFATEYAPLGDLTSNVGEVGIGEICTKRVARQVGSALEWVHANKLCHLDVKLDNILVFKSDFSLVKLCDFGAVRSQGDIIIKKNELLPYCPPELVVRHANEYYQVDKVQDVFQFGIVTFFCLFGILPWQRADVTDPNYSEFYAWRSKKTSKPPKNFKPMTSRAQKLFRRLMDVDPAKRIAMKEVGKFLEDKWLKKGSKLTPSSSEMKRISDGMSQLTMGSFQSVHSNAVEKNRILYTLLQHGVETTVDRSQKNSRIINWIQFGQVNVQEPIGEELGKIGE